MSTEVARALLRTPTLVVVRWAALTYVLGGPVIAVLPARLSSCPVALRADVPRPGAR